LGGRSLEKKTMKVEGVVQREREECVMGKVVDVNWMYLAS
jgi:hypothetical protein